MEHSDSKPACFRGNVPAWTNYIHPPFTGYHVYARVHLCQIKAMTVISLWITKPVNCLFWLLTQMCTQEHFWLVFTVILTILNNTRQCFYQSKTVDSLWPVNVLTTCVHRIDLGKYINILTDFDPCTCSSRMVKSFMEWICSQRNCDTSAIVC